jgi:hypothetical protein
MKAMIVVAFHETACASRSRSHRPHPPGIPANANPFALPRQDNHLSVDTLQQERDFRERLKKSYWGVIAVDKAHNVAAR